MRLIIIGLLTFVASSSFAQEAHRPAPTDTGASRPQSLENNAANKTFTFSQPIRIFISKNSFSDGSLEKVCGNIVHEMANKSGLPVMEPQIDDRNVFMSTSPYILIKFPGLDMVKPIYNMFSIFSGPRHFLNFLNSDIYNEIVQDTLFSFEKLIGTVYVGTAHMYSSDIPIFEPHDLSNVLLLSPRHLRHITDNYYDSQDLVSYDRKTWDKLVSESYSDNSSKLKRNQPTTRIVILFDTLLARKQLALRHRKYLSTTRSRVAIATIVYNNGLEYEGGPQAVLNALKSASRECSKNYYDREISELAAMKKEGTIIAPANFASFRLKTRSFLENKGLKNELGLMDKIIALDTE